MKIANILPIGLNPKKLATKTFCNPIVDEISLSNKNLSEFFINMKFYQKNYVWAYKIKELRDSLSLMIKSKADFDTLISYIQKELPIINKDNPQQNRFAKLRINQSAGFCFNKNSQGCEYYKKYANKLRFKKDNTFTPNSNPQYKDASLCTIVRINDSFFIRYGYRPFISGNNLDLAKKEYQKLIAKNNPNLDEINQSAATINWLIAQSSPFLRGSATVGNIIPRAIYQAYNVQLSTLKKGNSFDFEAFHRNLDDYIKFYPKIFTKKPCFKNGS